VQKAVFKKGGGKHFFFPKRRDLLALAFACFNPVSPPCKEGSGLSYKGQSAVWSVVFAFLHTRSQFIRGGQNTKRKSGGPISAKHSYWSRFDQLSKPNQHISLQFSLIRRSLASDGMARGQGSFTVPIVISRKHTTPNSGISSCMHALPLLYLLQAHYPISLRRHTQKVSPSEA